MQIELDGVSQNTKYYPPGWCMPEHSHDCAQITIVLSGQVRERVGDVEFGASSLDVVVKPAQMSHANEFGPTGARTLQIQLLPECLGELHRANDNLQQWGWYRSESLAQRFLPLLENGSTPSVHCLHSLLAAIRTSPSEMTMPRRTPPQWLESIRRRVDNDYVAGIRVGSVANQANVHRVVLARAFRMCYGESITQRLRRLRVARSAHLLGESTIALSDIAYECGFADQSHLTRVFKSYTGLSPGRYRKLAAGDNS